MAEENFEKPDIRRPVFLGLLVILMFFGIFGIWAVKAPIESAAIAPGVVNVESQRKTIQHLEGGIIKQIHVAEAQEVSAGEELLVLDDTQTRARLELLLSRYRTAKALEARLLAERDELDEIVFPAELVDAADEAGVTEILENQRNVFNARRQGQQERRAIIGQRVRQVEEEMQGLNAMIKTQDKQLALLGDEMESNEKLFEKGLTGKERLRALQRNQAEVIGERSQNMAALARGKQNIEESRLQITELRTKTLNELVQLLGETQNELSDLVEKVRAAEDVLARTVIRSQIDGTIVNLQVHSVGGVISPGQPLMDIVPQNEKLVIEAHIDPNDIDVLVPGLKALVRITAFSQRNTVPLEGEVISVSADRFTDAHSGLDYFLARVQLQESSRDLKLSPGMQAEVMIVTGSRTTLDYLSQPLTSSFNRAFREN